MQTPDNPLQWSIGLVGYGEVGRILAEDLRALGVANVLAYDIKLGRRGARVSSPAKQRRRAVASPTNDAPLREHAERTGVQLMSSHAALAAAADLVISAVTASQAVPVAESCAPALREGTWFLDLNSSSPGARIKAAGIVDAAGGRYVEGAVMTSIPSHRIRVPLLLGGPHAATLAPPLNQLGFSAKVASEQLGVASAIKMCRSVMIKGLEAIAIESFTAARAYGVEDAVLASLGETFPGIDWEKQGAYFFQRAIEHGRRRSEEMREVAVTVREIGLTPWSAQGTAERQAWIADLADENLFGEKGSKDFARNADWRIEADRILTKVKSER